MTDCHKAGSPSVLLQILDAVFKRSFLPSPRYGETGGRVYPEAGDIRGKPSSREREIGQAPASTHHCRETFYPELEPYILWCTASLVYTTPFQKTSGRRKPHCLCCCATDYILLRMRVAGCSVLTPSTRVSSSSCRTIGGRGGGRVWGSDGEEIEVRSTAAQYWVVCII